MIEKNYNNKTFSILGTGKTKTLVAAIAKIVNSTDRFVLVCANSNAACDEIAGRLVDIALKGLYRMYAKSVDVNAISEKIKPISNIEKLQIQFPSLNDLYKHRVVICTLATAGCLLRARGEDPQFDSGHFSYVIIDEAASVQETLSMIPIAGISSRSHREIWSLVHFIS